MENPLNVDDLISIPLFGETSYIYAVIETQDEIEIFIEDTEDASSSIRINKNIGTSIDDAPYSYFSTLVTEPEGNRFIVFSKPEVKTEGLEDVSILPKERISTEEQILARLQADFPWVVSEDLSVGLVDSFTSEDISNVDARPDKNRLFRLYDTKPNYDEAMQLNVNSYERKYIAARNYLRAVEFAAVFSSVDSTQEITDVSIQKLITGWTPEQKSLEVFKMLAELETGTHRLLEARRQRELALFGVGISRQSADIDRFASKGTLDMGRAIGVNFKGLVAVRTDLRGTFADTLEAIPLGQRRAYALAMFSDINSHEQGHKGLHDVRANTIVSSQGEFNGEITKKDWPREEIWNEWKSVVYPRGLLKEDIGFVSSYQYNPSSREKGGAWELNAMRQELDSVVSEGAVQVEIQGETFTVDRTFIESSMLASSLERFERGVVEINGRKICGFAELYDAINSSHNIGESFDQRLAGCSDEDYSKARIQHTQQVRPVIQDPKYRNALGSAITNIVLQKVAQQAH